MCWSPETPLGIPLHLYSKFISSSDVQIKPLSPLWSQREQKCGLWPEPPYQGVGWEPCSFFILPSFSSTLGQPSLLCIWYKTWGCTLAKPLLFSEPRALRTIFVREMALSRKIKNALGSTRWSGKFRKDASFLLYWSMGSCCHSQGR